MTSVAETAEAGRRHPVDKFAQRRSQLADAALLTLSELGYARTSLREIAQNSEFSHGVLHYYFTDKVDLITHCVQQYKARCVQRFDTATTVSVTAEELLERFSTGMARSMVEDAAMHRLWYDLRTQSLFEEAFQADIGEIDQSLERLIWRIVSRFADLCQASVVLSSPVVYAIFDGLFQQSLLRHLAGDVAAQATLRGRVHEVMRELLPSGAAPGPG